MFNHGRAVEAYKCMGGCMRSCAFARLSAAAEA